MFNQACRFLKLLEFKKAICYQLAPVKINSQNAKKGDISKPFFLTKQKKVYTVRNKVSLFYLRQA